MMKGFLLTLLVFISPLVLSRTNHSVIQNHNQAYFVIANYYLDGDDGQKVNSLIGRIVSHTQKEKGNVHYYSFTTNKTAHSRDITFIEAWQNKKAHERHIKSDFFQRTHDLLRKHYRKEPSIQTYSVVRHQPKKNDYNHLNQVATIGSLARGVYDGDFSYGKLFNLGNQGLGTLEAIDGEMVAVDGIYYQINAKGKLRKVGENEIVPFAEVVNFKAQTTQRIQNITNYQGLMSTINTLIKNKNLPVAIRIDGVFANLHLRSLKKQTKPYPTLVEAAKHQAIFDLKKSKGTIVGFWFPKYWAGIAVPGYHLHFVSSDRSIGGHVLNLSVTSATLLCSTIQNFSIHLPKTTSFSSVNLDPKTLHQDIKSAEGGVE